MSNETDEEDAVILYAVLKSNAGGAEPGAIASYCDYVNHLRPSEEDVEQSLTRLSAAGWVKVLGTSSEATPEARAQFSEAIKDGVRFVDGVMKIFTALQTRAGKRA
jgi:hypothetical protein